MLKITTAIKNRIPSANLIFRNDTNKGVNLIYFPEIGNKGTNFINLYRKKNYWDYIIVLPAFTFLGRKILTNTYFKEIRTAVPQLRVQKKFLKTNKELSSIVIDMTPLSEQFAGFIKTRSKKQTVEAFLDLVKSLAIDNTEQTGKDLYLVIDSNDTDEKTMTEALFYLSKLNSNKFRDYGIDGIVAYGNSRFWPLTINESDKDGNYFKINLNIITRFFKEVHNESIIEEKIDKEKLIQTTKDEIESLYKIHSKKESSLSNILGDNIFAKDESLKENPLEAIKHSLNSNPHISGKNLKEKLENLYKSKKPERLNFPTDAKSEKSMDLELSKVDSKKIEKIDADIKLLNKKYNGVIELNENIVNKSADNYYKPLDIIGFNDFHAYNRQSSEFDQNLDEAMFELIKSLESDKDLNIKVLGIQSEITDNYRDRYKTFKVKVQHKEFGHSKPYTVKFHIPYPAQGKYLKLNGNNFIATNQFFPKPVIKVKPNLVRVYTHYATVAISLKRHIINEQQGAAKITEDFSKKLQAAKKAKDISKLTPEKSNFIKEKYNLPSNLDSSLFLNININDEDKDK